VRNCSVDGCGKQAIARGWCRNHYTQWHRTGDPVPFQRERATRRPVFVQFTPDLWKEWWLNRIYTDSHAKRLREGIEQFRSMLA
jgi:hypothetical protein